MLATVTLSLPWLLVLVGQIAWRHPANQTKKPHYKAYTPEWRAKNPQRWGWN
ncbi:hypothetical protein ASPFODRAFT_53327 [Aspergillus luchuensis CBS 106.47]|uniref:Uncharacterized protein n=1 Tax=Aspergillus luchuensis (strain CBS 106.47) TaxID=1137211 RepID=A0A1M3T158_ASPLC|nr:hypothetical protein ASPFODRAFT_53327 [Aspergillus luchuensis CBS 106.47]